MEFIDQKAILFLRKQTKTRAAKAGWWSGILITPQQVPRNRKLWVPRRFDGKPPKLPTIRTLRDVLNRNYDSKGFAIYRSSSSSSSSPFAYIYTYIYIYHIYIYIYQSPSKTTKHGPGITAVSEVWWNRRVDTRTNAVSSRISGPEINRQPHPRR